MLQSTPKTLIRTAQDDYLQGRVRYSENLRQIRTIRSVPENLFLYIIYLELT